MSRQSDRIDRSRGPLRSPEPKPARRGRWIKRPRLYPGAELLEDRRLLAAPFGAPDHYATPEDMTLSVPAFAGVLSNDSDPDDEPLEAVLVDGTSHGSLSLLGDGSFNYEPAFNYSGPDSFTYKPWDGTTPLDSIATQTVLLVVNAVNDAPTANLDHFDVTEGIPLSVAAPGVLVNDYTPDLGKTLAAKLIVSPSEAVPGSFILNSDGSFSYTPRNGFSGTDTFVYRAIDNTGLSSDQTTVVLAVAPANHPPVPVADGFSTEQGVALFVASPGVLGNDSDPENDPLGAFLIDNPTGGNVTLSENGSFVYTPDPDFSGTDTFTYQVSDGRLRSTGLGLVTIAVSAVNRAPIAQNDAYASEEDQRLVIVAPGVLGNDSDPEGSPTTTVLVNPPQSGTLALDPHGSFVYTPEADFVGTDRFTYRVTDGQKSSEIKTVSITVKAIPATTVWLDAASDTGVSNADRITRDNTPTFQGNTRAGLEVRLFERPAGSLATPVLVGSTTADSLGNWQITTNPLPDGFLEVSVAALRGDGLSTGTVSAGILAVDTLAPVIRTAVLRPGRAQLHVTLQDAGAGIDLATMTRSQLWVWPNCKRSRPAIADRRNSNSADRLGYVAGDRCDHAG